MKWYGIIIAVITLFIVVLGVWASSRKTLPSYSINDPNKPIALVDKKDYDFGKMKESDIKDVNFKISNTGKSDLTISQISTSCDCTYATIIKSDGTKSPRFTMRTLGNWKTSIAPNETATLEVTYKPSIMPVKGFVERSVSMATDDPNNPSLTFKVTAEVE